MGKKLLLFDRDLFSSAELDPVFVFASDTFIELNVA